MVEEPGSLASAVESAQREAMSAFGDATVFIEPYASRPRHIEVQIMGDTQGNVVHLFERECSIQRRHQKIVEESPSPALGNPALGNSTRAELCDAAVRAAKAIGYVNAGTVEFLMLEDGSFAFLEVNTRLQVEHPVTELVTGLDLVRLQLLVAEGGELPEQARFASMRGHAIEVRLYAEDPTNDWRPSVGHLHRFRFAGGPTSRAIRLDSGVEDGSVVSPWYDPMLAKVIAHAPTRPEAARALATALSGAQIHGVTTNRDLLVRILRHPEFLSGDIDTGFLVRHDPAELGAPLASSESERLHAVAAALAAQSARRSSAKVLGGIPSGWRNNPSEPQREKFIGSRGVLEVTYRFDRRGRCSEVACRLEDELEVAPTTGGGTVAPATGDGTCPVVEVMSADAERVVLLSDSVARAYCVNQVGPQTYVDGPDGSSVLTRVPRFTLPGSQLDPGSLVAPLPGTVVRVHVAAGDEVSTGDTLVAIEAMKMEHEIRAGHSGVVSEVAVGPGDQVEAGRLLVVIDASIRTDLGASMDFDESEEQQMLRAAVSSIAARYGHEYYVDRSRAGKKTDELWDELAAAGYLGVNVPERYGGGGQGITELAIVEEELAAQGCPLLLLVVSPAICATIISEFGTDEQRGRWLPGFGNGSLKMAFAITEPDAGSNSHNISTTASRDGDVYRLERDQVLHLGLRRVPGDARRDEDLHRRADRSGSTLALRRRPRHSRDRDDPDPRRDSRAGEAIHRLLRQRPGRCRPARRHRG